MRMAILPRSISPSSVNASESTNSDIVNPIPPKQATANNINHEEPCGISATRALTAQ